MIQLEWIFLQRVMKDKGQAFVGLGKVLRETFLSRLLFGISKTSPPVVGSLSTLPVNKYELVIQNPMTSEK